MGQIKRLLLEEFIDNISDEVANDSAADSLGTDPVLHLPKGDERFTMEFKSRYSGIYYHWRGHDEHFYPLKTIYKKIYRVLERQTLLIEPSLSLPYMSDGNNKIEARQIELDEFSDNSIDVNSIYKFNELSYDTIFTFRIDFRGIRNCSFQGFIRNLDEILMRLQRAIEVFNTDYGEIRIIDNLNPNNRSYQLYTKISTSSEDTYL